MLRNIPNQAQNNHITSLTPIEDFDEEAVVIGHDNSNANWLPDNEEMDAVAADNAQPAQKDDDNPLIAPEWPVFGADFEVAMASDIIKPIWMTSNKHWLDVQWEFGALWNKWTPEKQLIHLVQSDYKWGLMWDLPHEFLGKLAAKHTQVVTLATKNSKSEPAPLKMIIMTENHTKPDPSKTSSVGTVAITSGADSNDTSKAKLDPLGKGDMRKVHMGNKTSNWIQIIEKSGKFTCVTDKKAICVLLDNGKCHHLTHQQKSTWANLIDDGKATVDALPDLKIAGYTHGHAAEPE
ncbi:hypothetical protein FRB99_002549 [Tulasnella sp. 403]|nr:hypothetical protein FRB99_002549 [Tulasnella sp. 403]